jgi:uncharacterized membrane protein
MERKKLFAKILVWIFCVIFLFYLLYIFYTPSPTITAGYFVIVIAGIYILWKGEKIRERGAAIKNKIKMKVKGKGIRKIRKFRSKKVRK